MTHRVWIIDDEPTICWALKKELERNGYRTDIFATAEDCLDRIQRRAAYPDIALLDVRLPGKSGLELLGILRGLPTRPAVIVMTAFGDLKVAVDAVHGQAFEYLTKPFDLSTVLNVVERAAQNAGAIKPSATDSAIEFTHDTMLGDSQAMQGVYKRIAIAAQSDAPVLIDGETGTGKSLVARMIHRFSDRAAEPLVFFRPDQEHSAESDAELFGACFPSSVSGSHAGPNKQPGLMLLAGRGTMVIDEVVNLSIAAQARLLAAIETGSFQAIASAESDPLRARLLLTSSFDLEGVRNDGLLYEPLAIQLRVIHILLPPLRERREDIRGLAQGFLAMASPDSRKQFSERSLDLLSTRAWPGNVRQLKQAVQYAAVHARGNVIEPEDLPATEPTAGKPVSAGSSDDVLAQATRAWLEAQDKRDPSEGESSDANSGFLHDQFLGIAERALIQAMLEECGGNRAAVASRLGIHRTTLRQKMKRYGL
jgi:two-component system nitrogen regulation response regulator GlnG